MRRVETLRGGVRLSMSVSAPFVWRCLSGSAVASHAFRRSRIGAIEVQIGKVERNAGLPRAKHAAEQASGKSAALALGRRWSGLEQVSEAAPRGASSPASGGLL
jgi:hypothetical protein